MEKPMREGDKQWAFARAWWKDGRLHAFTCSRCGVNGNDMADKCTAPLEDPCPGFMEMERLDAEWSASWKKLAGRE